MHVVFEAGLDLLRTAACLFLQASNSVLVVVIPEAFVKFEAPVLLVSVLLLPDAVLQIVEPLAAVDVAFAINNLMKLTHSMSQAAVPIALVKGATWVGKRAATVPSSKRVCLSLVFHNAIPQIFNKTCLPRISICLKFAKIIINRIECCALSCSKNSSLKFCISVEWNAQALKQLDVLCLGLKSEKKVFLLPSEPLVAC